MFLIVFFKLLIGHALADFPLQGEFLSKYKNWHNLSPAPPGQIQQIVWSYCLTAHALIHGGFVWAITGRVSLGLAESVVHWFIDFAKCCNWTGIHTDQALHVACKVLWTARLYFSAT